MTLSSQGATGQEALIPDRSGLGPFLRRLAGRVRTHPSACAQRCERAYSIGPALMPSFARYGNVTIGCCPDDFWH